MMLKSSRVLQQTTHGEWHHEVGDQKALQWKDTLCVTYYHLLSHLSLMPFLVFKINFVFSILYFPHLKCMTFSSQSCARFKLGIIGKHLTFSECSFNVMEKNSAKLSSQGHIAVPGIVTGM